MFDIPKVCIQYQSHCVSFRSYRISRQISPLANFERENVDLRYVRHVSPPLNQEQ